jgi:hypothetical protein
MFSALILMKDEPGSAASLNVSRYSQNNLDHLSIVEWMWGWG